MTTDMPTLDLEELKRRLKGTYPLPWDWDNESPFSCVSLHASSNPYSNTKKFAEIIGDNALVDETAKLIVAAVNSLPALIAEAERLRAEKKELIEIAENSIKAMNAVSDLIEARKALAHD